MIQMVFLLSTNDLKQLYKKIFSFTNPNPTQNQLNLKDKLDYYNLISNIELFNNVEHLGKKHYQKI